MACATSGATRDAFGEKLAELGATEPRLVVLDGDLGGSTRTTAFMKKFPERHFEVGIAEQNLIGISAGMALAGKIPVATVKLVGTHAGIGIGDDGPSQMGLEDIAAMRALPGMTVLQPADGPETRQAVEWMVRHRGPVYLRLTRQNTERVHGDDYRWHFGKLDCVWKPAQTPPKYQAAVLATGGVCANAVQAAKDLDARGFKVQVYNVHTLQPIDVAGVAAAAASSTRIVTVEDHNLAGGLGSAVAEALAERGCGVAQVRLGLSDFAESGTTEELYDKYGLSARHIAEACLRNID